MAETTNVLSLCSGGGGLDLGVHDALRDARTVCYVENEVTACGVLAENMEKGWLDDAPIWTNLRTFDGKPWRGVVDWVIGGYPCQPFSFAGKQLGTADPRHLWPSVERIVAEVQPTWCFFENVGAHLRTGFYEVAGSLQGMGYSVAATLLTAEEVGAPHKRERLFILAHRNELNVYWNRNQWARWRGEPADDSSQVGYPRGFYAVDEQARTGASPLSVAPHAGAKLADAGGQRLEGQQRPRSAAWAVGRDGRTGFLQWPPAPDDVEGWTAALAANPFVAPALESEVCDMVNGVADGLARADQLHTLGNGVVPQQAAYALALLLKELT